MRTLLVFLTFALPLAATEPPKLADTFAMKNLVAWCIVPYDSQKRTPKQRVEMLQRLGFTQFAYDWRAEQLPSFPEELELLKKAKIMLKGVWFPASVGKDGEFILEALKKADVQTELWVMLPQPKAEGQEEKVKETAALVKGLAQHAAKQGCKVGIYNHGGWTGEPENMVAVAKACGEPTVGIVYNMHHGHSHLPKLDEYLKLMQPHLYCVNLNGMDCYEGKEQPGRKIVIIGDSANDNEWIRELNIFAGPYGILGHTEHDVEERLLDNLNGLKYLFESTPKQKSLYRPGYRTSGILGRNIRLNQGKFIVSGSTRDALHEVAADERHKVLRVFVDQPKLTTDKLWHTTHLAGAIEIKIDEGLGLMLTPDGPELKGCSYQFTPRFPLEPGLTYRVIFNSVKWHLDPHPDEFRFGYYSRFTIPNLPQDKPTTIEAVYPTSGKLPENALRMYLHFSAPMKQGLGQKHIQLTCDGKKVEDPFLHIEQELWSADGKRLTILFDPARVKRGLKPREEAGPILIEGKKHTLTIDAAWPDALGFPLKEKFTYSFDVGPPDDKPIVPAKWKIAPPTGTTPLSIQFEKPLDKALSERLIWVVDPDGKRMEMTFVANKDQTGIAFPLAKWRLGKYKLVIDTRLEDLCGNRVGEAFEVDEFQPVTKTVAGKTVEREFEVK